MSAEIIPFRAAQTAQPSPAVPGPALPGSAGEDRLQRALAALDAAVTGQRAAVAEWRRSLEQLGATMNGLGASLGRYRDSLTKLERQVDALNGQAVALEQWADQAQSAEQG
jgi:ABC-type transporter Mla subunit MlaD